MIGPLVAPVGTVAWIWVTAVTANDVGLLLNSTLVVPTKLNPWMVTPVFVALRRGEKPEMRGATRKLPLLTPVPVGFVTRICPLVASNGTVAAIRASEVTLKSAIVVSNFTCVAVEKPDPLMTTCVPGLPVAGEKLLTTGAAQVTGPAR